jgi:putative hemin transport protein
MAQWNLPAPVALRPGQVVPGHHFTAIMVLCLMVRSRCFVAITKSHQRMTRNEELARQWEALRANEPGIRIRNAASVLGVSEAELLATRAGNGVVRLQPAFQAILAEVGALGRVMALTRNSDVVHERKGTYLNPSLDKGPVGLFVGAEIDLRIFWQAWGSAFAVEEEGREGVRRSIQFFARDGEAIHKIYLLPESDQGVWNAIAERFAAGDQDLPLELTPFPADRPEQPDAAVDAEAFRQGWLALQDTHDFHMLVHRHGLSRTQALRLAPDGMAVPLAPTALRSCITAAANDRVPIMVFVGNRGMLQIHTGTVEKLADIPGWFNVLDPDFNLHVREEALTQCWLVRKPTADGVVTAIECYDAMGRQLVQVFGKRKPGVPELESWRELAGNLVPLGQHA